MLRIEKMEEAEAEAEEAPSREHKVILAAGKSSPLCNEIRCNCKTQKFDKT